VLTSPQHYMFHYVRDGVLLLCCSQEEMPPLLAIEFMVRCAETFVEYFGDTNERTLRAHFVTVYQLLEEMCDSGMPLVTECSILKVRERESSILKVRERETVLHPQGERERDSAPSSR
jgi:AP-3 complex subunit mu